MPHPKPTAPGSSLTTDDLRVGVTYRGKRPMLSPGQKPVYNDRTILAIQVLVQYDSPAVPPGKTLPWMPAENFLAWAGTILNEEEPDDDRTEPDPG